jgi:hypothetical protein
MVVLDEVRQLEEDVSALHKAVKSDKLNSQVATEARSQIANRLEKIKTNSDGAKLAKLSDVQKRHMFEGLERLQQILLDYPNTLVAVDITLKADSARAIDQADTTLVALFSGVIINLGEAVQQAVDDSRVDASVMSVIKEINERTPATIAGLIVPTPETYTATFTAEVLTENASSTADHSSTTAELIDLSEGAIGTDTATASSTTIPDQIL